jgi:hypothetical protein
MPALTLWEPWASAVAYHGKDVENRSWAPPRDLVGQRIAIHAGMKIDKPAIAMLGFVYGITIEPTPGHVLCTVRITTCVEESSSEWFVGPVGWVLDDVQTFDPVPMKGRQGIWRIP